MINKVSFSQDHQWLAGVALTLLMWLGGSLLLDFIVMPSLYIGGMMQQSGFAATGYMMFGAFNRVEVLLAAIALSGILAHHTYFKHSNQTFLLGIGLFSISLIYTYGLTPHMSALGFNWDGLSQLSLPQAMAWDHSLYFGLEMLKLGWLVLCLYRLKPYLIKSGA